ncbi:MAG: glycosyltransferase family 4 protein [Micromonosporaceae bacterium]
MIQQVGSARPARAGLNESDARRPRICMGALAPNGGTTVVAQELGLALPGAGFDVRWCTVRPTSAVAGPDFVLDAGPGESTCAVLDVPPGLGGALDAASGLLRIHDAWPFDLFHVHNLQVYGYPAQVLRQLRGVPYVVTCHGSDVLSPRLLDQHREVAAAILSGASAVTCVSQHVADTLHRKIPGLGRVETISNFVRTSWQGRDFTARPEPRRFLHVSSMRAVKRPQVLLAAFAALQRSAPDAELVIVSTGDGLRRLDELLRLGVHDGHGLVVIDGDREPDALVREYARAQALVLTSEFEGFGLVALEALLHQVPVIAVAVGALPEVMGTDWPYLVPDRPETQLGPMVAAMMLEVANTPDPSLPVRMLGILDRYQGPKQIDAYARLYRQVISQDRVACRPF